MRKTGLLGIDLGTSSLKAVLVDAAGNTLARAAAEYGIDTPRPGWAEQDSQTWVRAAIQTIQRVLHEAQLAPREVEAIGFSGQMHGLVCVDAHGEPLRPAVIWADQRSQAQVEQINLRLGKPRLGEWTGNPAAAGFMLPSWLWLVEHEPETARKTARLLLPKDALRLRLTGAAGSEPSDASSTLLFDTAHARWSQPVLDEFGIDPALLPPLFPSAAIAGGLTDEMARLTGLRPGTPAVYGGADQAVQALGNGLIVPGWLSCTIGTGGQLLTPTQAPVYDPGLRLHVFCHVVPQRWYLMAATLSAGLALKWLRDNLFPGRSYQELADEASQVEDADGLLFLPHLIGERTPYMDPGSTACFVGLTLRHRAGHLIRAVMEGVVFSLRQGLDLILSLGLPVERVLASGGGKNHPLWLSLMADTFNRPIHQTGSGEAAPLGAALLAGIGAGVYPDAQSACQAAVRWQAAVIEPDPERRACLEEHYARFRLLYPALRGAVRLAG